MKNISIHLEDISKDEARQMSKQIAEFKQDYPEVDFEEVLREAKEMYKVN